MDIIKSKRGRPRSSKPKDGKLFIRLPKKDQDRVRRLVKAAISNEVLLNSTVVVEQVPANNFNVWNHPDFQKAVKDYEDAMLDVRRLEAELVDALAMTDVDGVAYWRNRALKCEKAKGNEYDQESS